MSKTLKNKNAVGNVPEFRYEAENQTATKITAKKRGPALEWV